MLTLQQMGAIGYSARFFKYIFIHFLEGRVNKT